MFIMKININSKCILNTITPDFSIISTLNNKGKEEKIHTTILSSISD